eukprot:CAMPEP_0194366798 /NCGR_PEP_ID=MMETSP0174-20130528/14879_1 /TAXON_ID=216777 /ORGANISM="Proboscia alata, Strain PI-D3" /LENGTH=427 /DNA_ID=CAMNT_0039142225 /DNA_START=86 /DNA_END=1369 /DNA_ORIENTATION=-
MTSSYADMTTAATEHLDTMASLHPDLAEDYKSISQLFSSKLWHQLTVEVLDFVSTPVDDENNPAATESNFTNLRTTSDGSNSYLALYDRVVLACDAKLNQLSLAQIASVVATSLASEGGGADVVAARAVLENLLEKKSRLGKAASLFLQSKLALLSLRMIPYDATQEQYESIGTMLRTETIVLNEELGDSSEGSGSAVVHSAFYEASTAYRKRVGPPEAFYQEALMFLNYTPVDSMTVEERYTLATDLSLAALTGEGVFNFGEVVTAPILNCLKGTPNEWLMELMHCFTYGEVDTFLSVTEKSATAIRAQPALVSRAEAVREKITLLAFVNMVFERPSAERTLSFEDIATRTKVSKDRVDFVIMRALSLGLIKGIMDQVDETVDVSWVMPRVLNELQLKGLSSRFGEWAVKVAQMKDFMGEHTPSIA